MATARVRATALVALLAAAPLPSSWAHPQVESSVMDAQVAAAAFEQARTIAAADGGELWGVELDFPILFVDPDTRQVIASREDADGVLAPGDGLWFGQFPPDRGIANFATEWAGTRWTMLIWPPPTDGLERARLLLHESFHNAQDVLGVSAATTPCTHLATFEGRRWMRLEARALAIALESDAEDGSREDAAGDALLFRAWRRSLFPSAADAEDALERVEGSAEYTGLKLCTSDEAVRAALCAESLRGLAARPSLTRSFQYATGPAIGLLMDAYDPLWRESFLAGRSFTELLSPAIQFEVPANMEAEALARAARYGLDQVTAEETRREEQRQERLATYRVRYLDGPVLILPARSVQRSFDPNRVEPLDGVGTVYGTLWVSDDWGVADAPGGALVLNNLSVHLPGPSDLAPPALAGDGWTLELNPGWSVVPGLRAGDFRLQQLEDDAQ